MFGFEELLYIRESGCPESLRLHNDWDVDGLSTVAEIDLELINLSYYYLANWKALTNNSAIR